MGKKSKRYEKESRFGRCEVCQNEIPIEFYFDKGEVIFCADCSSEYIIQSRSPVRLMRVEEDFSDGYFEEMEFN